MNNKNIIIKSFGNNVIELVKQIAIACPKTTIAGNTTLLTGIIRQYPTKFIDLFVLRILKYKTHIETGDDSFLLTPDFDDMTEFKTIWKILTKENKEIVCTYLVQLCDIATEYLDIVSAENSHS